MLLVLFLLQKVIEFKTLYLVPVNFLYCMLQIDGTIKDKIKIYLLEIMAFPIIGNMVLYGSGMLIGKELDSFVREFLADLIITILLWVKYFCSKKIFKISELKISVYLLLLLLMFFSAFMVSGCSYLVSEYISGYQSMLLLFVISGTGLMICVVAGLLLYIVHKNHEYDILLKEEEKFCDFQKQYYLSLLDKEKETRKFRHDIVNHLLAIYTKMKDGKSVEACRYIEELQGELLEIKKINYDVGNDMINAILNYYFTDKGKKIKVEGYLKEIIQIKETDLCVIISNLAQNMLQHADWENDVMIMLKQGKKSFVIETSNMAKVDIVLDEKDGLPKTTKSDRANHGYGLRNIKNTVNKYHGDMKVTTRGRELMIKISFSEIDS